MTHPTKHLPIPWPLLAFALSALLLSGCLRADAAPPAPLVAELLVLDARGEPTTTLRHGETLSLVIRVSNRIAHPVRYQLTGPGHDFVIEQRGEERWSAFHGMAFAQVISERTLGFNQVLELRTQWHGQDNSGQPLPPGEYRLLPRLVLFVDGSLVEVPGPRAITIE